MLRLHGHELSGNSYKVRLLLELLGVPYEWVRVDLMKGEHKLPAFLALNPFAQVPVLEEDGTTLSDAQAILFYLAARQGNGQWLPTHPRLVRLEQLVLLIAQQVGVPPEAIERLLPPAAPEA